jgi:hypothetical protein
MLDQNRVEFRTIMIVSPLSARNKWQMIEMNLYDFIIHFFQNNGEKYRENQKS